MTACLNRPRSRVLFWRPYLDGERSEHDGTEDGVPEDAVEDVPLAVDLAGVDLVEQLHHDKGVEDDGVVLRRRRVEGGVSAAVDVKDHLAWGGAQQQQATQCLCPDELPWS